ncbi:PTS transporter subunit IIC [uncultured Dysosmobacter sp.]|uniref:PTS transporter subunit IIC n=1 Tax=uncultured Dysosmobacter sp. TaxID=2591384 RepID=UPI002619CCA6|nr:PTS sugar transporter subunit IIC [uncultured Dysosmobacter sp.]
MSNTTTELTGWKKYCKEQNIEFSVQRILIDGLGGMAHGLFASLLIGTIFSTIGVYLFDLNYSIWGQEFALLVDSKTFAYAVQGAAMAGAIAYSMKAPPFVIYSCLAVGYATNSLGGAGGPLAVFFVTLIAVFLGKLVSKRTPVDLIVTPTVTIVGGVFVATLIAPPIGAAASWLGNIIMWATNQQPFLMGILVAAIMGIVLTLPISSAAICAALGLVGLAGGAAVAGCCAHMVGFAVASYRENGINGLTAQGIGTSMLQVPNLVRKPVLWLPAVVASVVNGPIATCLFKLKMNGAAISSGMGTCGFVGPIGVITGWINPSEAAAAQGEVAYSAGAFDWIGLIIISIIVPAVVAWLTSEFMRKKGMIQEGDYKLDL